LDRIPEQIEAYRQDIDKLKKDIHALEKVVNTPWRKEKELTELKGKLDTIERRIKETMTNNTFTSQTNTRQPKEDDSVVTIRPVMPETTKSKPGIKL